MDQKGFLITLKFEKQSLNVKVTYTAWKVYLLEVFLACIFPHSDWIRRDTPYLFVLSLNARKCGQEKLRIRTLMTQCWQNSLTTKIAICSWKFVPFNKVALPKAKIFEIVFQLLDQKLYRRIFELDVNFLSEILLWEKIIYFSSILDKIRRIAKVRVLTHSFPTHPFSTPWKHQKTVPSYLSGRVLNTPVSSENLLWQ